MELYVMYQYYGLVKTFLTCINPTKLILHFRVWPVSSNGKYGEWIKYHRNFEL